MKNNKYNKCKFCGESVVSKSNKFNLVECKSCKLIFSNIIFSQNEFENVYNDLYNKRKGSHYNFHTQVEFLQLKKGKQPNVGINRSRIIKKYINKNTSVLEIGSGIGLIGEFLKINGVSDYLGLELDEETFLKSKELGLNVINTDFSGMKDINREINIIMLWEVLEHLQDIKLFLRLAYEKLSDDGILMFSVPNFSKVLNYKTNLEVEIHQDLPPIHLNFFNDINIFSLLKNSGFKIDYYYKKKHPYISFRSKHFYKMLFKSFFGKYEGSTIYVAARKTKL